MSRRFLTVEDLRRAGGREVLVDADTVVTPQALEVAREEGIVIRTADGPWREPAPDRGPDAARAAATLPHLPEPLDDRDASHGAVVTVVGRNRPGVLAEVTRVLADCGANVDDISQKKIEGWFHVVLLVELPPGVAYRDLNEQLACLGGADDYVVRVMHERVFRFMHRI